MTEDLHYPPEPGSATDLLAGAVWCKSTRSGTSGNCVEVATNLPGLVAIRDSKNPDGPKLVSTREDWQAFLGDLKAQGHQ